MNGIGSLAVMTNENNGPTMRNVDLSRGNSSTVYGMNKLPIPVIPYELCLWNLPWICRGLSISLLSLFTLLFEGGEEEWKKKAQ
jgi:hypothetical protein